MNKDQVKLIIVKVNPYTLSTAIIAYKLGIRNITFIDNNPLKYWGPVYKPLKLEMNTPVTMDLVSMSNIGREYSLAKFLDFIDKYPLSQANIEGSKTFIPYIKFRKYLENTVMSLKGYGIKFIEKGIEGIYSNYIKLEDNSSINFTHIVLGYEDYEEIYPSWITSTQIGDKRLDDIMIQDMEKDLDIKCAIVGTSNKCLYYCNLLSEKNIQNTWFPDKRFINRKYILPSFREWSSKTAYSSYYSNIPSKYFKQKYKNSIENYPIGLKASLLNHLNNYKESKRVDTELTSSKKVNDQINRYEFIYCDLQKSYNISALPIKDKLSKSEVYTTLPKLRNTYNAIDNEKMFFIGPYSMDIGGVFQSTLNSTGYTSEIIIKEIIK